MNKLKELFFKTLGGHNPIQDYFEDERSDNLVKDVDSFFSSLPGCPIFEYTLKRMNGEWELRWVWCNGNTNKKSKWEGFDTLRECMEDYIKNN